MLSSSFLDTAIGIIFVFLLLSLIASTINEIILSFLSMRGKMLLGGIATLLNDENLAGLVPEVYKHGQIYGLYKGDFTASATQLKQWWWRGKTLGNLPSYIPTSNFASAFLGVMMDRAPQEARTALDDARQAAMNAMTNAKIASQQASLALNDPNSAQAQKDSARAAASAAQAASITANLAEDMQLFHTLRVVADGLGNNKVAQPLLAMLAAADDDLNKLRAAVEAWYDSAMDRVSGWYKYHTQWMLFWIGLVLAIGLNANTVVIAKQISRNDTLRQTLVNAAAKAPSPSEPNTSRGQQTNQQQGKSDESGSASAASATRAVGDVRSEWQANHVYGVNDMICTNGAKGCASGTDNVQRVLAVKDDATSSAQAPIWSANVGDLTPDNNVTWKNVGHATTLPNQFKTLAQDISQVEGLGLPLGWGNVDVRSVSWGVWPGWLLGWLLTAIAVSLGAPFWFDLLNKFMVVRSTVKPQEKSKEEGSKDKQP